ncbi:hypothetical protein, partial [Salinimicrobium sp. WS361]|uniref:hypothetical protein n=1 Tax=Salinimicrobium sp. WS361 TaxID=3425123 RepID=UPI003D6F02BC
MAVELKLVIAILVFCGSLGAMIESGSRIKEYWKEYNEGKEMNKKFISSEGVINILVFPFDNFSQPTESNFSTGIFNRLIEFQNKLRLDRSLNIKFYDLEPNKRTKENIRAIGEKLNADMVIHGSYDLHPDNSYIVTNLDIRTVSQKFSTKEEKEFKHFLQGLEQGDFTASI